MLRIVVLVLLVTLASGYILDSSEESGDRCCDRNCQCGFFQTCSNCNTCILKLDYVEKYKCYKDPCRSPCAQVINVCGNGNILCNIHISTYPRGQFQSQGPKTSPQSVRSHPWSRPKSKTFEEILSKWNL